MTESNILLGKKIVINGVNYIVSKGSTAPTKKIRRFTQIIGTPKKAHDSQARTDVIFEATAPTDEWILGEYRAMTLVNHFDPAHNSNRTVATFTTSLGDTLEKSSDSLTKLIGQKSYNNIFLALLSVLCQQLKVKAIVSLLTGAPGELSEQSDLKNKPTKVNISCQTDIFPPLGPLKSNANRKIKQRMGPYVVKDGERATKPNVYDPFYIRANKARKNTKNIIYPPKFDQDKETVTLNSDTAVAPHSNVAENVDPLEITSHKGLPEIHLYEEDSMSSLISLSQLSVDTSILEENTKNLLHTTDEHMSNGNFTVNEASRDVNMINTNYTVGQDIVTCNGVTVHLPFKPEDIFHLAVPEILARVSPQDKIHLLCHQAYIDWKYCLQYNEDDNLPIHEAVLANDVPFINRQCIVLKARQISIDIGDAAHNLSPLQLAIANSCSELCVSTLLRHGANPLNQDAEGRTVLHRAAESARPGLLALLVDHCSRHARNILEDIGEWRSEWEQDSSQQLTHKLFLHIGVMFDSQGYSAAMVASKLGHHEHLRQLLAISAETINEGMPNSGNTPLYLAVEAASLAIVGSINRSAVPEGYAKTIEILLEYGADPNVDNFTGSNVNTLLAEYNLSKLCIVISNKQMSLQSYNGVRPSVDLKNYNNMILMKEENSDTIVLMNEGGTHGDEEEEQDSVHDRDENDNNDSERHNVDTDTDVAQCQTDSNEQEIDTSQALRSKQCFIKGKPVNIQQYIGDSKLNKIESDRRNSDSSVATVDSDTHNNDSKGQPVDSKQCKVIIKQPTMNIKIIKVASNTIKRGQMLVKDPNVLKVEKPSIVAAGGKLVVTPMVKPSLNITQVTGHKRKSPYSYILHDTKKKK